LKDLDLFDLAEVTILLNFIKIKKTNE